jgi:uncharacterized phiE125 gp8 family phage protein
MGLALITPAAAPPVALAAVKAFCAVEDTSHDAVLTALLAGAVRLAEAQLGQSLGEQDWRLTLDAFSDAIELPRAPVLAVTAVNYVDAAGAAQLADPGLYTVDLTSDPQWLVRNADAQWPEVLDAVNVVSVNFTAGYAEGLLPPDLAVAICMIVAAWFDNRGSDSGKAAVPAAAQALLDLHRRILI